MEASSRTALEFAYEMPPPGPAGGDWLDWLTAVARRSSCRAVADTGGLGSEQLEALRARGLETVDLRAEFRVLLPVLPREEAVAAGERLLARLGHEGFLLTCLEWLPRTGPADLAGLLANLGMLAARRMLVALSLEPGPDMHVGRGPVLPYASWSDLLWEAGFRPAGGQDEEPAKPAEPGGDWAAAHWQRLNPYREGRRGGPRCLLFERRDGARPDFDAIEAACARILGPRLPSWPRPNEGLDADWTFLIGHVQDFSAYVPFWSVLDKDRVRVILRRSADRVIPPRMAAALESWLKTRGIRHAAIAKTGDWDWAHDTGRPRLFLAHSESNIGLSHSLNAAFSATARFRGELTAVMQHGIWLEEFAHPAAFASSYLLAWSRQHAEFLNGPGSRPVAGCVAPRGLLAGTAETITGAPKFDVYANPDRPNPSRLLGAWAGRYERTVVCTTNLQWTRHASSQAEVRGGLASLAERFPRWLFVVKPHPTEPLPPEAFAGAPPNLAVLDEMACWWAGITTADLIRTADVVLSTLSTTVLEAALAGRPCVVLDTGNPVEYEDVAPTAPAEVAKALAGSVGPGGYGDRFASIYYDRALLGRSLATVFEALREAAQKRSEPGVAEMRSICMEAALGSQLTWFAEEFHRRIEPEQESP